MSCYTCGICNQLKDADEDGINDSSNEIWGQICDKCHEDDEAIKEIWT